MTEKSNRRKTRDMFRILCLFVLGSLLAGCSIPTNSTHTSIALDETGSLIETIVEDLGDGTYNAEELQQYVEQDIAAYNRGKEDPVTLQSCKIENGSVRLSLQYATVEDYSAFNQVTCFQGTLQQAEEAGFSLERTWLEPNGREGVLEEIRERQKEWKVFVVSEPVAVKVPDKILYASDNVSITGRLTATVETVMNAQTETEEQDLHPLATVTERFAYIIYK